MEDGLVQLQPYFGNVGTWCLNPCCNGRWSRTAARFFVHSENGVLILVVMEDGLVHILKQKSYENYSKRS